MKNYKLMALVLSPMMLAPAVLMATPITGSIQFIGGATASGGAFVSYSGPPGLAVSVPLVQSASGDYGGVSIGTASTWSSFKFNSPAPSVTPLWNMNVGGRIYSFDATSMTVISGPNSVNIKGTGIAHITGFDDTFGTWTVSAGGKGVNFTFGASTLADTAVPDGGTTVMLLGTALAGLAMLRRKLA